LLVLTFVLVIQTEASEPKFRPELNPYVSVGYSLSDDLAAGDLTWAEEKWVFRGLSVNAGLHAALSVGPLFVHTQVDLCNLTNLSPDGDVAFMTSQSAGWTAGPWSFAAGGRYSESYWRTNEWSGVPRQRFTALFGEARRSSHRLDVGFSLALVNRTGIIIAEADLIPSIDAAYHFDWFSPRVGIGRTFRKLWPEGAYYYGPEGPFFASAGVIIHLPGRLTDFPARLLVPRETHFKFE
jgi:hypothetical protein